jgi:hypothetical protein
MAFGLSYPPALCGEPRKTNGIYSSHECGAHPENRERLNGY